MDQSFRELQGKVQYYKSNPGRTDLTGNIHHQIDLELSAMLTHARPLSSESHGTMPLTVALGEQPLTLPHGERASG